MAKTGTPKPRRSRSRKKPDSPADAAQAEAPAQATLPDALEVTAELDDGTSMGLRHRELPIEGVQFHPESIRSEHGHAMLQNFLNMTKVPA